MKIVFQKLSSKKFENFVLENLQKIKYGYFKNYWGGK